MPAVHTALGAQSLQPHLETFGILCLLVWLFSLVFAVSHRRMCVPSLQLLAETPCDPWSGSSCYCFISLMPRALSLWHHRCTVTYLSCSPQLQLLTLWIRVHTGERAPSPHESLKWSFMERQTVLKRCRTELHKHNQQSTYKPPIPVIIFSSLFLSLVPPLSIP